MRQLRPDDVVDYMTEAYAAEALRDSSRRGIPLLRHAVMKAVMRQPSTRTGGSCTTAMQKLGGSADLISGMSGSSEAKGESITDSWVAFATQADILGIRTAEDEGPKIAALAIAKAVSDGGLPRPVPVINLGDGKNEHPTQALGDLFTIHKRFKALDGLNLVIVGDHERYRAFHSLLLGAVTMGMHVVAVESVAAPVSQRLVDEAGSSLEITRDLDEAMAQAHVLYVGRNPDEYDGDDPVEKNRGAQLAEDFRGWAVDFERIQKMRPDSIVMHPRPRRNELNPNIDSDPRAADVGQMFNMIPMRMAIIARHLGASIAKAAAEAN
jgi:aspartate carbamoyltransferase catalytic subunit